MNWCGFTIIESAACQLRQQFRFPRSKKRRIRKKWAARESNVRYIPQCLQMGQNIIMHPSFAARLRAEVAERERIENVRFLTP